MKVEKSVTLHLDNYEVEMLSQLLDCARVHMEKVRAEAKIHKADMPRTALDLDNFLTSMFDAL